MHKKGQNYFRRPVIIWMLLFFSVIAFCISKIFFLSPQDQLEYEKLMSQTEEKTKNPIVSEIWQSREGVNKHITVTKKGERVQFLVNSAASNLCLEPVKGKIQVVEHLKEVQCDMQELGVGNGVRKFISDNATYYYGNPTGTDCESQIEGIAENNVKIENEFGVVRAHKMLLLPSNAFPLISLQDQVSINLHDGGQLFCNKAEIDCNRLNGYFTGSPEQDVIYSEEKGENKAHALIVKGRQMGIDFERGQTGNETHIREITAENHVAITYDNDLIATGDRAIYSRNQGNNGILTLETTQEEGSCLMVNENGDRVKGSQICLDTLKKTLHFVKPNGTLKVDQANTIEFTADHLDWDHPSQILYLKENVAIKNGKMLTLVNDQLVAVHHVKKQEKNGFTKMTAEGRTKVVYDDQTNLSHNLLCTGNVIVDHEKSIITLKADPNTQVYFHDGFGQIRANEAVIDYTTEGKLKPVKMTLFGDISIINKLNGSSDHENKGIQYALSDKAVYDPETCKLKLIAKKGKRVLVYDKLNNLQVSAPTLEIHRDKETQKESIKGTGDVRFTFKQQEFELLKKRMSEEG